MNYDIIGDIHGQPLKLTALLTRLGYRERAGAWRHPERTAVFVGDFIDRGPGQIATLQIVRAMVDAGSALAVMGNHEYNAIAWFTKDPQVAKAHLRVHSDKNRHQHQAFLAEVEGTPRHAEWIAWFKTLPLWLENDQFRAVHACWHPENMAAIADQLGQNHTLTDTLLERASRKHSIEYNAVENVLKGLEVDLPEGVSFTDKDGHVRHRTRVRWWDPKADTYQKAALIGKGDSAQLPDTPIPADARVDYDNEKPVFFGHYWFTGKPNIVSARACCVDYSAARDAEPLVAYRYEGEADLSPDHLIAVGAGPLLVPSSPSRTRPRLR